MPAARSPSPVTPASPPDNRPSARLVSVVVAGVVGIVLAENLGAGLLYELLLRLPGIDKAMHWVQYILVFFVFWWAAGALRVSPWTRIGLAVAGGIAVGVLDETVQRQLAKRTFELEDLAVDAAALAAGAAFVAPIRLPARATTLALSLGVTALFAYDTHQRLVHVNRGLLYERQHDLRSARDEYRKAVAAGHTTPGLYNSLAWVEVESGDGSAADAVRYGERALAARPNEADFLDTYGWALHHVGRSQEALGALQRARTIKPDIYCVDYHLGVVLQSLARPCDARTAFERQIARFPKAIESTRAAEALTRTECASGGERPGRAR
jgi:tetratricopeptide (TPR) repeat protein